jgi:hypothetical protein
MLILLSSLNLLLCRETTASTSLLFVFSLFLTHFIRVVVQTCGSERAAGTTESGKKVKRPNSMCWAEPSVLRRSTRQAGLPRCKKWRLRRIKENTLFLSQSRIITDELFNYNVPALTCTTILAEVAPFCSKDQGSDPYSNEREKNDAWLACPDAHDHDWYKERKHGYIYNERGD